MQQTQHLNISETVPLTSPRALKEALPLSSRAVAAVVEGREEVRRIIRGEDARLLVVAGPCSMHHPETALEYARRLVQLRRSMGDRLCIIMRAYFEKPRTVVGWKGLIHDPHLDGSEDMSAGMRMTRQLLAEIGDLGLPVGAEVLDPIAPQYLADLFAWASIGARTIASQTHRQMASGLSMPVGFKNTTEGCHQTAIQAMQAARQPHNFLGIDQEGRTCVVRTRGNPWGHLILRGGEGGPNYDAASIAGAQEALRQGGLEAALVVDCSHANSGKRHQRQMAVLKSVLSQRVEGNRDLVGVMIESNLEAGRQDIPGDLRQLRYGVSVTDECVGWDTTEAMVELAYKAVQI
ncbi:MAG: 3-deoxy-7-phosphoheptulonate synthase [Candidatus Latescibacteria bacterium]|nr:3-deoxy-7-phosphoheptulonate synthase [Candidatus Latescibacterota bacterium]